MNTDTDWELAAAMALLLWPDQIRAAVLWRSPTSDPRSIGKLFNFAAWKLGFPATCENYFKLIDAAERLLNANDQAQEVGRAA